ncbi:unnamed protein product [Rotaria sordida]|uniref:LTD domain-containing protein n=1 Tax=Rotaria sordida TaxID=392033 RepID=A0A813SGS2_9BILA|nr:unnamed protein product [Rotaria sordida]CAF3600531.1 unnamed protein product [Rotaria sordida]
MHTSTNSRKTCSKCDKSTGAFSCDGCQQSFCLKHVAEHRQELTSQMDYIEQQHDIFHEDLLNQIQKNNEHILFNQIDQWEKESIYKIEQAAQQARIELHQILDNIIDHGKKLLNKISLELRRARELDDFFEKDLTQWRQQLNNFHTEIERMSTSINIIDDSSTSLIKPMEIVRDQTIKISDTNRSNQFSWLSNVKALFHDRFEKLSLIEHNETKKYSTQAFIKGSIGIIKVNNIDHYIDIENDGLTGKDQDMTRWIIRRDVDKQSKNIYKFPDNFILKYRSNVRILYNKTSDMEEKDKEILIHEDMKFWNIGSHVTTYLIDNNDEEKASIVQILAPL